MKKVCFFSVLCSWCCWLAGLHTQAQSAQSVPPAQSRKPLTITAQPKLAPVIWKNTEGKELELRGQLTFSLTQANDDDTFVGWMLYLLPDAQREKLAKQLEQPLKNIPPYLVKTDVPASWVKGASCPFSRMESGEIEFEILGGKIHFKNVALEFRESQGYLPQLICHWTRQINTRKQRRAIIAAINRALKGDEPE